jgi:hypothetical protein
VHAKQIKTLLGGHPTPNAELCLRLQRQGQALDPDPTGHADGFGSSFSPGPCVEEYVWIVLVAAGPLYPGHAGHPRVPAAYGE